MIPRLLSNPGKLVRRSLRDAANAPTQLDVFRAYLAEDYDGISQFVMLSMSRGAISSAARAYVGPGDRGTGALTPRGTPVVARVHHGRVEIIAGLGSAKEIITSLNPPESTDQVTCNLVDFDNFNRLQNPGFGHAMPGDADWDEPSYAYPPGDPHNTIGTNPIDLLNRHIAETYAGMQGYALLHVPGVAGKWDFIVVPSAANNAPLAGAAAILSNQITNKDEFKIKGKILFATNFTQDSDNFTDGFGIAMGSPVANAARQDLNFQLVISDSWDFFDGADGFFYENPFQMGLSKDHANNFPGVPTPVYSDYHIIPATGGSGGHSPEQFALAPTFEFEYDRSVDRGTTLVTISHFNGGVPFSYTNAPADPLSGPLKLYFSGWAVAANRINLPWYPFLEMDDLQICNG